MRHIMVATDGSKAANRAIDVAAKLAKVFGGKLLIVTVDGPLPGKDIWQFARAKGDIGNALELLSDKILAAGKTRAERLGVTNLQLRSALDDPAQSIIKIALSGRSIPSSWGDSVKVDWRACCSAACPTNLRASRHAT
jgi:nucleotide-binding universal stress UspA family protein